MKMWLKWSPWLATLLLTGCGDNPFLSFVGSIEKPLLVGVETKFIDQTGKELGGFATESYSFSIYPFEEPAYSGFNPVKYRGTFVTEESGRATISIPTGIVRVEGVIRFAGPPQRPFHIQQDSQIHAGNTKIILGGQLLPSPTSTDSQDFPSNYHDPWYSKATTPRYLP